MIINFNKNTGRNMYKLVSSIIVSIAFSLPTMASQQVVIESLEKNDVKAAKIAFKSLGEQEKKSLAGQILKGRLMLANEDTEDGFDFFEELAEQQPTNIDVFYYWGMSAVEMAQKASIFSKLGYAEDYLDAMGKVIELNPNHLDALEHLIGFHLGAPSIAGGDTEKAVEYAHRIKALDAEKGYAKLANIYQKIEKEALAVKTMDEGLSQFPQSSQLYFVKALGLIEQEAWLEAHNSLASAIKFASTDEEKEQVLYQQGKTSSKSGLNLEVGIKALEQVITQPNSQYFDWGQYRLAQLYLKNDQASQAKALLAKVDTSEDDDLKKEVKKLKKKVKRQLKG
jgi:tetratricopeptide (TPR) repeat protein